MTKKTDQEMPFLGGSVWAWAVGAVVAGATVLGATLWSGSPSTVTVEPVGVTSEEAADPTSGTAPADRSTGDIIRNQLDPRSR